MRKNTNTYIISEDNIIRRKVGNKWNPACPNNWFQSLVEKLQDNKKLDYKDDLLYGQCIMSLIEIVLNNVKFRFQKEEVKDEMRGEMLEDMLTGVPKLFDRTRGSTAYSYAFRIAYVAGIHVLERKNIENDLFESLEESYLSNLVIEEEV